MGLSDLPCAPARDHIRAFERLGFRKARQDGSHVVMKKDGVRAAPTIPDHGGKDISRAMLQSILRTSKIPIEDYLDAFHKKRKK